MNIPKKPDTVYLVPHYRWHKIYKEFAANYEDILHDAMKDFTRPMYEGTETEEYTVPSVLK